VQWAEKRAFINVSAGAPIVIEISIKIKIIGRRRGPLGSGTGKGSKCPSSLVADGT